MSTNKFNPAPIFEVLPSFWKEYYKDSNVLSSVYEALLRIQEVDYNRLFSVDDSKALSSTPILTRYPVVYERLEDWESLQLEHAHVKITVDFDSTVDTYLGGTTRYYRIQFPGHILKYDTQLYIDGLAIPTVLYQKSFLPYFDNGIEVFGTTVYLDVDKVSQADLMDLSSATVATIYSYRDVLPLSTDTNGTATSFDLDTTPALVVEDSIVTLERVDITTKVSIEYDVYTSITPKTPLQLGQQLRLIFIDDSIQYVTVADPQLILVEGITQIRRVDLMVNLQVYPTVVSVTEKQLTLRGNNAFYPGAVVRVIDNQGIQTFTITELTNKIQFDRDVDVNTVKVVLLGIDLLAVQLTTDSLIFTSTPNKNCTLKIDAVISNEHGHSYYESTLTEETDTVVVPTTLEVGSVDGNESEFYPTRVYVDYVLQTADTAYSISADTITFTSILPVGTVVTVFSDSSSESFAHKHTHQAVSVLDGQSTAILLNEGVSSDDPLEIFDWTRLYPNLHSVDLVSGRSLHLESALTAGSIATIHGITRTWRYKHVLADRTDARYGYRGRIKSAGFVQDGITKAVTSLSLTDSDFEITEVDDDVTLFTNVKLEDAWLFDVDVDERTVSSVWGSLLDVNEPSTSSLSTRITSLLAAARSASFVDNLENFGSIVLGSAYLEEEGYSLGVSDDGAGGRQVTIRPTDTNEEDYTVPVIDGAETRVKDSELLPRLFAVNKLLSVYDRDLSSVPWLAFMAQSLSSDFRFAKRLDARSSKKITSQPFSFNVLTGLLTDYSVDFLVEEVRAGDQIVIKFSPQDLSFLSTDDGLFTHEDLVLKVVEVVGEHQLLLNVPSTGIARVAGFGDDSYGSGAFGGGIYTPQVQQYVLWTRTTRRIDSYLTLDAALKSELALVSGEDITKVNESLADILKHHIFVLKLDWNQMLSAANLATLQQLIQLLKPASSQALVYTEHNNDAISEAVSGTLVETSPEISVSGDRVADAYYSGTSFIGSVYSTHSTKDDPLYNPSRYNVGPKAFALTYDPDVNKKDQQYYLVARRDILTLTGSRWENLYSDEHGLESLVLRSEKSGNYTKYAVPAVFGYRDNGQSVYLSADRRLRIPWEYDGGAFTFRTWMNVPSVLSPGSSPVLLAFGDTGLIIGVDYVSATDYRIYSLVSPAAVKESFGYFSPDKNVFFSFAYNSGWFDVSIDGVANTQIGDIASFSGDLLIGAAEGSPITSRSLPVYLDETVFLNYAASPALLAAWAASPTWSGPLGVGYYGSPLAEVGAALVLHYDLEVPGVESLYDYSGLGNNATMESDVDGDVVTNWFANGMVSTPLPSDRDYYQIASNGYYITDGVPVIVPVLNEDNIRINSIEVIRTGEAIYSIPNIAYYYSNRSWVKVDAFPASKGSSVSMNSLIGEFVGFVSGSYVGPDGNSYASPMSGDETL